MLSDKSGSPKFAYSVISLCNILHNKIIEMEISEWRRSWELEKSVWL